MLHRHWRITSCGACRLSKLADLECVTTRRQSNVHEPRKIAIALLNSNSLMSLFHLVKEAKSTEKFIPYKITGLLKARACRL